MMRANLLVSAIALACCTTALACSAALGSGANSTVQSELVKSGSFPGAEILILRGGVNRVDFDNDGKQDVITVGWRENNNAHGHMVYSFLRHSPADSALDRDWQVVPFEDSTGLKDSFTSGGGADCLLSDLRVLLPRVSGSSSVIVVTAVRDFGASYVDSAGVTFREFHLATNADSEAGWPDKYFKLVKTTRSAGRYCDVGDALAAEMALPRTGGPE